ncbi:hypothetical protein FQN57_003023 [Myotisia sp. PD_48]|nr:hypothetical protein FQN57_003023 [Myotisia sp. PD_48]
MTDTSSISLTHSTANPFPATVSALPSPVVNGTGSTNEVDEEPYTIKCICIFEDDDGSTVFCERCETWQHIVCYYDDQTVPEIHNCADCEPRSLDSKRATERQKKLREQAETGERRGKRSGSRAQKRKPKEQNSSEQPNGWSHERSASTTSRDHPPPSKKQRTSHRASNSVSSISGNASESRKRVFSGNGSAVSPAKSSFHPHIPLYSQEFLHLYDDDDANVDMQGNLFDTIALAGDLALWVKDSVALAQVANGRTAKEIFTHTDQPLEPSKWPRIEKHTMVDHSIEYDGKYPTWNFLKVHNDVKKDEIVGEVRGKVGHLGDYCLDPSSRWKELRHPEPFVFFHPQLPLYIDSRKEGTILRYIRRSCRPNVTLRTYITNENEYHFCFVANQDIPINSEISTTWYLDPQMFPSNGLVKPEGSQEAIPDSAALSISNVLAHFGGCACDATKPCFLANVDCRANPKGTDSNPKQVNGRKRKTKTKTAPSPDSAAPILHSRSGSEAVRNQDDDDHTDNRSTSGSVKDQPRSRGLTPGSHTIGDAVVGTNGGELSAREKRKIAAAEKKFEQLELDQQHKKKKRVSVARGHSPTGSSMTATTTPRASSSSTKPPRLDIPEAHKSSNSPTKMSPPSAGHRWDSRSTPPKSSTASTPRFTSPLHRPSYVDSGMQTEPDENDPQYVPQRTFHRSNYVPLTKRLLKRCHEDRVKLEELGRLRTSPTSPETGAMLPPPTTHSSSSSISLSPQHGRDVEMKDVDTSITPPRPASSHAGISPTLSSPSSPLSRHLPSTAAHSIPTPTKVSEKASGDIKGDPDSSQSRADSAIPNDAANSISVSVAVSLSPSLSKSQNQQDDSLSPVTNAVAPSPVKKKLTLNDYMSRRGTLATPTTDKPQTLFLPGSSQQQQISPVTPSPSSGNSEPTSIQLPFTKFNDGVPKPHSQQMVDIVMKDRPFSTSTHTGNSSNHHTLPRDPRLQQP